MKKKGAVRRKKEYHSVKKEKKFLWKRLVLAELHAGVQISNKEFAVKPKFAIHNVKKRGVLFFMQVPALIQKH